MADVTLDAIPGCPVTAVIGPGPQCLKGWIPAQPSKNYTTRFLLAAALAEGESLVRNIATSEDSAALQRCLVALGAHIELSGALCGASGTSSSRARTVEAAGMDARVQGVAGKPRLATAGAVNVGNAGAVLRFLLAVGALLEDVEFVTDRPDSLGKRPNADLLDALGQLGCGCESRQGLLPIRLRGGSLRGGRIAVSGARSSQFLSGLLFLAPLLREPLEIEVVDNLVSKAPVRQTLEVLRVCGIECDSGEDLLRFRVHPQGYRAGTFTVNGDWPGSAAVLAAAVATRSAIRIGGLLDDNQGERFAASALREMGALVEMDSDMEGAPGVRVAGAPLRGIEFDGDRATDAVLALVGAACFAAGKSRFHNVANLRIKECDRVSEPIAELRRIGVNCREGREAGDPDPDAIIVEGNPDGYEGGVEVDGRKDHRVIMLLATVGLGCRRGLRIRGAEHVAKSYPLFFRHLNELGADVRFEEAG